MNEEKVSSEDRGTEHLANRTFLASIRIGIAVLSLGFLVARFGLWLREMSGRFSPRSPPRAGPEHRSSGEIA